jgi:ribosomal protein S18 acetylase RimI-like enzyme
MLNMQEVFQSSATSALATQKLDTIPELSIRRGTVSDAPSLAALGRQSFAETHRTAFAAEEDLDAMLAYLWNSSNLEAELSDPQNLFLVAEIDGSICGLVKLRPAPLPNLADAPRPVELSRFYLDYDYIGQGIGARLMEAAIAAAIARGYQTCWLHAWAENHRAVTFYLRYKFEPVAIEKWKSGRSHVRVLVMARTLQGNDVEVPWSR